jgi:ubiquinone/menaquinone biosynthesis C-methylase UbiE
MPAVPERELTWKNIRESYDTIADEYARRIYHELAGKPFDRAILDNFADRVRDQGEVCDLGCGPGQVARHLFDRGINASGLDLSPKMIETARHLNPEITFRVGDMLQLPFEDSSLAGLTAFYAIVNLPNESLPLAFREMHRVLKPDGLLLLAFHIGDEVLEESELWGLKISMKFYMLQTSEIVHLLETTGFVMDGVTERDPYAPDVEYQSRRAYILARKPA